MLLNDCFVLYQFLQNPETPENDALSKVDCLMVAVGDDKDTVYSKSISLHVRFMFYVVFFFHFSKTNNNQSEKICGEIKYIFVFVCNDFLNQ